jgi:leucyl aminopeptidase (aminopeptidase T)
MLYYRKGGSAKGVEMPSEPELIEAAVKVALHDRVKLKRGENLLIECWPHGLPVAREAVYQARALGAHPLLMVEDEQALFRSVETLKSGATGAGAHEWAALSKTNAYLFVPGPANLPHAWAMGPKWGAAFPSNDEWYQRAARAKLRGVRMLYGYASDERAAAYGIDPGEWRRMVLDAATVRPSEVRSAGAKLGRILQRGKSVRIRAGNGTDINLGLAKRPTQVDDGSVSPQDLKDGENMTQAPAGQLWVAPDERTAEGTFVADRPSFSLGRPVKGAQFEFRSGKLVASAFAERGDAFEKSFGNAKGDKDRVGMLIFGLNPKIQLGSPQDAIGAGTLTLTLGYNDELGGKNKTSFQFLAPNGRATVEVDGKAVISEGRLTL